MSRLYPILFIPSGLGSDRVINMLPRNNNSICIDKVDQMIVLETKETKQNYRRHICKSIGAPSF